MTNRIDMIDEALLRPGRLEVKMEIGEHPLPCSCYSAVLLDRLVHLPSLPTCPFLPSSLLPPFLPLPSFHPSSLSLGLPDEEGRLEILQIHTAQMQKHKKLSPDVDMAYLAKKTRNFSGAEIEGLVRSAQSTAMNRMIKVHPKYTDCVYRIQHFLACSQICHNTFHCITACCLSSSGNHILW